MRFFAVLVLVMLPVQLAALSCAPWQVEDAFTRANDSDAGFTVVYGTLTFDTQRLPPPNLDQRGLSSADTNIPAAISGKSLTRWGFRRAFTSPVNLTVSCVGPWCAGARSQAPTLAFLEHVEGQYVLRAQPCASMVFQNPTRAQLRRVRTCFSGGTCAPARR